MSPTDFPESNSVFGPPPGMTEDQVQSVPAFNGQVIGGNCDGEQVVVVAWKPDETDLKRLNEGGIVYLMCFGGLPPHMLTTKLQEALMQG